jgi:DNA-binding transcriptional ArsR family regulator
MVEGLALEVRRLVYDGVIAACVIPSKIDLVRATGASAEAIDGALKALADAHMVVLQRDGGEVLMANPFSAVPTPFVVTAGSRRWYGNCIWDAMGIAAMLGEDALLCASCGRTMCALRHSRRTLVGRYRVQLKNDAALPVGRAR